MIEHAIAINGEIKEMIILLLRIYPRPLIAADISGFIMPRLGPDHIISNRAQPLVKALQIDK
ncbi:MAG: hypothetical protein QG670_2798 [Thermoproteota archaeon]|nr:hypothetical protein [Thermoproteota archaeon]